MHSLVLDSDKCCGRWCHFTMSKSHFSREPAQLETIINIDIYFILDNTFKGYALIRHCNLFMKQGCLIRIRYSGCAPIRKMDTQISSYDVIAWHGGSCKIKLTFPLNKSIFRI